MTDIQDEQITNAINTLTEKISVSLLHELLQLPPELQLNLVLIKSTQLMLANILCQVADSREELEKIVELQGAQIKSLTYSCADSGFSDKFDRLKH